MFLFRMAKGFAKYIIWSTLSSFAVLMGLKLVPQGVEQFRQFTPTIKLKSAADFFHFQSATPEADKPISMEIENEVGAFDIPASLFMDGRPKTNRLKVSSGVKTKEFNQFPENYVIIDGTIYPRSDDNIYDVGDQRLYFKPSGNGARLAQSNVEFERAVASSSAVSEESSSASDLSPDSAAKTMSSMKAEDIIMTPQEMLEKMQKVKQQVDERNKALEEFMNTDGKPQN